MECWVDEKVFEETTQYTVQKNRQVKKANFSPIPPSAIAIPG